MFEKENLTTIIIKWTSILCLVLMGIIFFVVDNYKPYILGLLFGTLMSILSFKLLEATGKKAITKSPKSAYRYTVSHYFIRYFLYFAVLVVAALADYLNFSMTVLGLLMVKLVITILTFVENSKKTKENS